MFVLFILFKMGKLKENEEVKPVFEAPLKLENNQSIRVVTQLDEF